MKEFLNFLKILRTRILKELQTYFKFPKLDQIFPSTK